MADPDYLAFLAAQEERRRQRTAHRSAPQAPYYRPVTIDGVTYSVCRGCGEPIRQPDGRPNRRRSWHPQDERDCLSVYLAARDPQMLRRLAFARDHGRCAGCGLECAEAIDRPEEARRRGFSSEGYSLFSGDQVYETEAQWWRETHAWEADHIVPLIDGGSLALTNVQTLCLECHKIKTGRENARRASSRRRWIATAAGQLELMPE